MKIAIRTSLLILTITLVHLKAFSVCDINSSTNGQLPYFEDSSGRKIHLDFNTHSSPRAVKAIKDILASKKSSKKKKQEIEAIYKKWYKPDHQKKVTFSAENALRMVKTKKIKWIGMETSPKKFKLSGLGKKIKKVKKAILELRLSKKEAEKLAIHQLPTVAYIEYKMPGAIFKGLNPVPLDDKQARDKSFKVLPTFYSTDASLNDYPELQKKIGPLVNKALQSFKPISQSDMQAILSSIQDSKTRKLVTDHFHATNTIARQASIRDRIAADRALARRGNGLIVFGAHHGSGMKKRMQSSCGGTPSNPGGKTSTDQ